jgi:hypothetical protein
MPVLRRFLTRLKLTVNEEKTRVVSAQESSTTMIARPLRRSFSS